MGAEAASFRAYLIFDFGADIENARRAVAQVEHWGKAFKLHGQMRAREQPSGGRITVVVRLEFEEFEKLAFERWLARIPSEDVFATAELEILRGGEERFKQVEGWFGLP